MRDDAELDGGHLMRWPPDDPAAAYFECSGEKKCRIEETSKADMLEAGEWRAQCEFAGHASFHIWAAYSLSPNATWGQIATECVEAKRGGPEKLRTFINTTLGQTWKELGEAPEWERLYQRRETYAFGTVPSGVEFLTAGVDVQKDRFVMEVVGWAANKVSFSIDAGELHGDTASEETWARLDELLARTFIGEDGQEWPIAMLGIDSGYNTQMVYNWARRYQLTRVIACKGVAGARMLVSAASPVDVTVRGKRMQHGYKVYTVGVDIAKAELYAWLGLFHGDGEAPTGYCHFPEYGEEYFKQLTAEHLVTTIDRRTRRAKREWRQLPNRENHYLDARILARAAASVLGLDRFVAAPPPPMQAPSASSPSSDAAPRSGWLGGGPRRPGRGWLK
jgi:phage terminase large subunit GpA-like protein